MSSSVRQQYEEGAARGGEVARNLALWREDIGRTLSGACTAQCGGQGGGRAEGVSPGWGL